MIFFLAAAIYAGLLWWDGWLAGASIAAAAPIKPSPLAVALGLARSAGWVQIIAPMAAVAWILLDPHDGLRA